MIAYLRSLDRAGLLAGLAVTALLAGGIVVGSRNLRDYDPILLTYTFGVLFSAFAVAYRYAVWLQRPPTRLFWRRGWRLVFRRGRFLRRLALLFRGLSSHFVAQRFIRRRGFQRWAIHFLIAWGTVLAAAVTFPLVFGWLHFETRLDDPKVYRLVLCGLAVLDFHEDSLVRHVMFNLLNLSAVMVIAGVALSLRRRFKEAGAISRQQFGNDIVPLLLLLAISITGLMLTFSAHALHGYGYAVFSLIHALTVTAALLYIPFGKFFHIFQRPAQLGVLLYREENRTSEPARCRVCAEPFAGAMHVGDLKQVMAQTGFDPAYLDACPRCRRRALGRCRPPAAKTEPRNVQGAATAP
jgi:hypothetical protein